MLFLLPVPWSAPVLAPVLVSLALVGCGALVLGRPEDAPSPLRPRDGWALSLGGALILASFVWHAGPVARGELPGAYPWWLFQVGWLGGLAWFAWRWRAR